MSTGLLLICLVVSIVLVVLAITKFKVNPAVALILGALLLGILTGVPLNDVTAEDGTVTKGLVNVINSGFGNYCRPIMCCYAGDGGAENG